MNDTTKAAADPLDGIEPAGWRYAPSDVWRYQVLTLDAEVAELARQYGREVEPLYTRAAILSAIERARADERERCAKVCDDHGTVAGAFCAQDIRALGPKTSEGEQ
jgi:hypothetical protein